MSIRHWLTILSVLCILSPSLMGQKISGDYSNMSLTAVLTSISSKYYVKIAFDTRAADQIKVNEKLSKVDMDVALRKLTEKANIKVQRMGDVYMLIPSPVAVVEKSEKPEMPAVAKEPVKKKYYISGSLKDKFSGESLPFATVYLPDKQIGTTSNNEGFFKIECTAATVVNFVINYLGYRPLACNIAPSEQLQLLYLEPELTELQSVVVREKIEIYDNSLLNAGKIKFNPSKLANITSLAELDISSPIQLLPGVDATRENAGGFIVRKSAPDKTLIVYDGFTIYHMNHFFGAFSSINTKAVKDIQLYKGGYDARYGGSASGLIEITGKQGNALKSTLDIGADMLAVDGKIEVPLVKEKLTLLVAGRRSVTDAFRSPLYNNMFENVRSDFESYYRKPPVAFTSNSSDPAYLFYDYNTKLTFNISQKSNISASVFGSADDLSFTQNTNYPKIAENTDWSTRGGSIRWAAEITPSWSTSVVVGRSLTEFNYHFSDSILKERKRILRTVIDTIVKGSNIVSSLKNTSINWDNTYKLSHAHQLEWGLNTTAFSTLYDFSVLAKYNAIPITDTTRLYNTDARLSAIWLQYVLTLGKWQFKPGLRWSYYSKTAEKYPELRISTIYKLNEDFVLKGAAGKYYQFVNKVNFIKKGDYRSAWVVSDNDRFNVVSANFSMLGFNYNISPSFNVDVEAYYKTMDGLTASDAVYKQKTGTQIRVSNQWWHYATKTKGVDFILKKSFGGYQLWTSYTLSQSKDNAKKVNNGASYWSDNDQRHELKVFNLMKLKSWCFTLTGIYGSGMPWDNYTLDNNLKVNANYEKNSGRLPAYYRADAGINYSIKFAKAEIKAGCNFFNIFNTSNIIDKFNKLSDTPLADIRDGINPVELTEVQGLGFASNFFVNFIF